MTGDIASYREAYTAGAADPIQVAERFLAGAPVGGDVDAFVSVDPDDVHAQADESARRLRAAQPLGPFEGILVGLKDVFDVRGYHSRGGTSFLAVYAEEDEPLVARLRAAGAIIAGKQRTTELGLSPVGLNHSDRSPRNPHDPSRPAGGSSSGAAASVAAGIVPLAIGTDGGGSVRIPPALSGVFGFKPTFGRIPRAGSLPVGWWSLDHAGPIARSTADLATAYAVLADVPAVDLDVEESPRFGVDWRWWGVPHGDVDRACRDAIASLDVLPVSLDHLDLVKPAAYVSVVTEVAAAMWDHLRDQPARFGADVQVTLQAATALTAVDYVRAQQARSLLAETFADAFRDVDILVVPTTGCTAPVVPPRDWSAPPLDEQLVFQLTRYTFPGNLVGLPAVTVPVGVDRDGLPIGLQLVGPRGGDDVVLRAATHLERLGVAVIPTPRIWQCPLEGVLA